MSNMPPKASGRSNHFQTIHKWPVQALLEFIPHDWTIWEPACGEGHMVKTMKEEGYDVVGTDILEGFDYLSPLATCDIGYDVHITNPPFSIKDEWLERCFATGKPFALLMPVTAIGEQERFRLYKEYGIQLILLPKRVTFKTPSGKEGGAWFCCAWFCHGLDLPSQIHCSDIQIPCEEEDIERCLETTDLFGESS